MRALILFLMVTSVFAETTENGISRVSTRTPGSSSRNSEESKNTVSAKNPKTTGRISTTGCELANGKTLSENDYGYADCVKQIGLKK